jgi:hypothetical protein
MRMITGILQELIKWLPFAGLVLSCTRDIDLLLFESKWVLLFELQDRGYKNIKILEERKEVGGKAYSRFYRGVWNEFGVALMTDIYDQSARLMERYNAGFLIRSKGDSTVWASDTG